MSYHPLTPLGYSVIDYAVFKAHLRLPRPWLRAILRTYRDLKEVPFVMGNLNTKLNDFYWSSMDKTLWEKRCLISGIPVSYINRDEQPLAKADPTRALNTITRQITKFVGQGRVLYFHSTFQDNATLAASQVMKAGIKAKVDCFMIPFTTLLEEIKTWEKNETITKVDRCQLLCLTQIGTEYTTDYTQACFDSLLQRRIIENKTTILVSSLTPKEWGKRYGRGEPQATTLEFIDEGIKQTLSDLIAELEAES